MLLRLLLLLPLLLFAVLAGWFLWGLDPERDPSELPSALIDKPVPEFSLPAVPGLNSPGLAREDLIGGGVKLVNVFASWCLPCRAEHPLVTALAEEGVPVHAINYKDKPEQARDWLAELGNPYQRIGYDETGRVGIEWGVYGVPETFVIDASGTIRYRHVGPLTPRDFEKTLRPLIRELQP